MHLHDIVCSMVLPFFVLTEYYNLSDKVLFFFFYPTHMNKQALCFSWGSEAG